MSSWADFFSYKRALNAIVAPAQSTAQTIGPGALQNNPAPIQKVTLETFTSSNPTGTVVVEGSLDGVNWVTIGTPAALPTVGSPKLDKFVDVNVLYARVNASALSAGNITADLMISGDPD